MPTPTVPLRPVVPGLNRSVLYDYHDLLECLLAGGSMRHLGVEYSAERAGLDPARADPDLTYALMAVVLAHPADHYLDTVRASLRMASLVLTAGSQAVVNEFGED